LNIIKVIDMTMQVYDIIYKTILDHQGKNLFLEDFFIQTSLTILFDLFDFDETLS
jgi:hypothetical protein